MKFDGVDLFLFDPHISIDSSDDDLARLADKVAGKGLVVGSLVAPVWPPTGGGSAMGERGGAAAIRRAGAQGLPHRAASCASWGCGLTAWCASIRAASPAEWAKDPEGNTKRIAQTFREACDVAEGYGERLAAEGEICWGGMHSWRQMVRLLEMVDRPKTLGFQADMAHTLLFTLGYNAPEDRMLPEDFDGSRPSASRRPWGK